MKLNWKIAVGTLLLAGTLFAGAPVAFSQVSVGIFIGAPPPPRVVAVRPVCPGPEAEYAWVEGYWYPVSGHYYWHRGYWTRPPYEGARWIAPRHDGERFYAGYWDGPHGRFEHDHHWDRDHDRDHGRWHDRDDDHDNGKHRGRDKDHDDHNHN
jgi:WXXGXW repeat (2 copies)